MDDTSLKDASLRCLFNVGLHAVHLNLNVTASDSALQSQTP